MAGLGHVSRPVINTVVQEYTGMTDPAFGFFSQGEEFVKKVLEKTFSPHKAEIILQEIYSSHGEIVDVLANIDGKTIANFLSQEHPQTIAVVLAKLKPKQAGDVISHLPQGLQADVVMRIADVDQVSPDILAEIDEVIKNEFTTMGVGQRFKVGGVDKVLEVFGHLDRSREKQILDALDILNPPLSETIRKSLFTFEDIFTLDERSIQQIMREVSNETLTLSLKTCTDDLKGKIYRNISSRAAEVIKEDLEVMGPVRLSDVEKAQTEIVKLASRLEEEGKIIIVGRGADDVLV
jgi:flagellar motor switch protein FliG